MREFQAVSSVQSPMQTAHVLIKTPTTQISATLRVLDVADVPFTTASQNILSFHQLPSDLVHSIEPLQSLVVDSQDIQTDQIVKARLALQEWFQKEQGYMDFKLRHIIPRSTVHRRGRRKTLQIQAPVQRFHTDSTHTAFVNIWLPMSRVTDFFLGFLYHPEKGCLVTAESLSALNTSKLNSFLRACWIVYSPGMDYGQAILFQSGGSKGVLHGSFRLLSDFHGDDEGQRESVEFRCQTYNTDSDSWVYGDVFMMSNPKLKV